MISAGGVAAMVPMIEAMNPGWAFTFIGLVYAVWTSMLFYIMRKGQQWRDEKAAKEEEKRLAKEGSAQPEMATANQSDKAAAKPAVEQAAEETSTEEEEHKGSIHDEEKDTKV